MIDTERDGLYCKAEDLLPIHPDEIWRKTDVIAGNLRSASGAQKGKVGGISSLHNSSARTVTKEHTGGAIFHIEKPGELLGTDDKSIPCAGCF